MLKIDSLFLLGAFRGKSRWMNFIKKHL